MTSRRLGLGLGLLLTAWACGPTDYISRADRSAQDNNAGANDGGVDTPAPQPDADTTGDAAIDAEVIVPVDDAGDPDTGASSSSGGEVVEDAAVVDTEAGT